LTFAQLADEQLPPAPPTTVLRVYQHGKAIAQGRLDTLAGQPALAIEERF
jgi:hypothetical protein